MPRYTYTPGPWKIQGLLVSKNSVEIAVVLKRTSTRVPYGSPSAPVPQVAAANGILIAKAPELARVLADLMDRCDGPSGMRRDGSNIDTLEAHHLLAEIDPDTWDEQEVV